MVKPAGRARRIAMPPRDLARGSDEAVFKLISTTKSRAAAKRMVRYVARARKSDRDDPTVAAVKLRDGEGEVLSRTDAAESFAGVRAAVDGAFEGLELTPEAENLKKDAAPSPPAAPPAGDLEPAPEVEIAPGGAAPPAGDLSRRQAYHFTFSAPLRQRAELIAFEEAARAAIEENFTDAGHRCLWAVHGEDVAGEGETQHGHAHVHMVVKAGHENGGPRLQIGAAGRDVRELRESFAAHAREAGLTAESTWREDRAEVRDGVAEGTAVLRPHRDHSRSQLARRAPDWALAYEPVAIARREAARVRRKADEPAWPSEPPPPGEGLERLLPRRPKKRRRRTLPLFGARDEVQEQAGPSQAELEKRLEGLFVDAPAAVETWRELRTELEERGGEGSYADWWLANRPEAFGDPLAGAFREDGVCVLADGKEFRKLLAGTAREMPVALPPRAEGAAGVERRDEKAVLDAALASADALDRRQVDLGRISSSLRGVASALVREEPVLAPLADAVQAEASRASEQAVSAPAPVNREPTAAPPGAVRPGRQRRRPSRDRGLGD